MTPTILSKFSDTLTVGKSLVVILDEKKFKKPNSSNEVRTFVNSFSYR